MSKVSVEVAIEALRRGHFVIMVDDANRENEGDLVLAAQFATPDQINFMVTHARGLVCLALEEKIVDKLGLPLMTPSNEAPYKTAFTVSIEAKHGVTTGISAHDRAHTIQTAIGDDSTRADVVVPGHIFPLKAQNGGVLVRAGHTEGSVDLVRLAGLKPAAVICEILNANGTMARLDDLKVFAQEHGIPIVSIADIILYRLRNDDTLVKEVAESLLPTKFDSTFKIKVFQSQIPGTSQHLREHVALVLGDETTFQNKEVLVRVHSECLTGDVFGSQRCDCGAQLDAALQAITKAGEGVLLYLRQEGRGIGLRNKIKAYELQDQGLDTVQANIALGFAPDQREYGVGAQILRSLGIKKMRLLSNNPKKLAGLEGFGLSISERVPLVVGCTSANRQYLQTKKEKMGHLL